MRYWLDQLELRPRQVRSAFTLIELLIAVSILVLLSGLLMVGIGGILGSSREAATRATLKKVHEILEQQQNEFQLARSGTKIPRLHEPCHPEASEQLMEILHWKRKYREAFPQQYGDLFDQTGNWTPMGSKVLQIAVAKYTEVNGSTPTPVQAREYVRDTMLDQNASAELLYLIVTEGVVHGVATTDSDQFTVNEVQDTDGDGLLELVDAWGNPLRFYRWPTRMIRPCDPANPTTPLAMDPVRGNLPAVNTAYWQLLSGTNLDIGTLGRDADDPLSWLSKAVRNNLGAVEMNSNNTCVFHTPDTYAPLLVVSMGADQELGLYEPHDTVRYGHLAQPMVMPAAAGDSALNDNLTNLQGLK